MRTQTPGPCAKARPSAEVERMRALLEQMTGRTLDAGEQTPAATKPRTREGADAPVVACALMPERQAASSFEANTRRSATISWHPFGSDDATAANASHTFEVPVVVARSFGTVERTFPSRQALHDALDALLAQCAWQRLLSQVSARERSASHLERSLVQEGFPASVARATVERARACQIVDDARFAETFARSKVRAGWGSARIERALEQEGVDTSLVAGMSDLFSSDAEEQRAWDALQRKRVPERNPEQKLARFLTSRGFSPALSLRLARRRVEQERASDVCPR